MTEIEARQNFTDEAQSMRLKYMETIADWAGISQPTRAAKNAEALRSTPDGVNPETLNLEPTRNNEGLRRAMWLLNTYRLSIYNDGLFHDPSEQEPRADWEVSKADRILARIKLGEWRSRTSGPMPDTIGDPLGIYLKHIGKVDLLTAEEEVQLAMDIEAGLYAVQKLEGGKANRGIELTIEERKAYAEMALAGKDSFDRMYEANLRLVVSIAKKYPDDGMPLLDRIQEGNIGLRHAIEKFDYTQGYKFSVYAKNWIKQAIDKTIGEQSRTITASEYMRFKLRKIQRYTEEMAKKGIHNMSIEDISKATKIEKDDVIALLDNHYRMPKSLDSRINDETEETLLDKISDRTNDEDVESIVVEAAGSRQIIDAVRAALTEEADRLDKQARPNNKKIPRLEIMTARFGLDDGKPTEHVAIAAAVGLGRGAVSRAERDMKTALSEREDLKELYLTQ